MALFRHLHTHQILSSSPLPFHKPPQHSSFQFVHSVSLRIPRKSEKLRLRECQRVFSVQAQLADQTSVLDETKDEEEEKEDEYSKTRVIVQNVPWNSTVDDLRPLFEKYGTVLDIEGPLFVTCDSTDTPYYICTTPKPTSESRIDFLKVECENQHFQSRFLTQELSERSSGVVLHRWCGASLSMYNKTRNRGLAFVTMGSYEEALASINNLESYEYEGRKLKLNWAKPKPIKPVTRPPSPKQLPVHNLFVANLPFQARGKNLKDFFNADNGNAVSAEIVFLEDPRRPAGYGFVSFNTEAEAEAALSAFHGKEFMGRQIRVARSKRFLRQGTKAAIESDSDSAQLESSIPAGESG